MRKVRLRTGRLQNETEPVKHPPVQSFPMGEAVTEHWADRQGKKPAHLELVTRADKLLGTYQKAFGYQHINTVHGDQKKLIIFKTTTVIIFV